MATINPRALLAQRNAMVAFTRYVAQARSGGLMNAALEMLTQVLPLKGALAYRAEERDLVLVGDHRLPRRAKPWLAHLPRTSEGWFVAQKVAHSFKPMIDKEIAEARMGHSIRPVLEEGGWKVLAAAPIALGRDLHGVLVLAAERPELLDQDALLLLETISSLLALGEERERAQQREEENRSDENKTAQLATIGVIATTAARDLAAPLGAMQLQFEDHARLLAEMRTKLTVGVEIDELDELNQLEELDETMAGALRSAQTVTSRLLSFGRESTKQTVDLQQVFDGAVEMLRPQIEGAGIKLEEVSEHVELLVDGRQESLQTLLAQLLLYAKQECEAGGPRGAVIRMGLSGHVARFQLTVETSTADPKSSAQVFDSYVIKQRGQKTGVGLALAKQTVLAHNGHIEYGNSELGGVLIRVVLPASAAAQGALAPEPRERRFDSRPQQPAVQLPPSAPKPLMLWVDPDELGAKNMRHFIKTHEVIGATSLAQARQLMLRGPSVVFCDVNLPDGSGVVLHHEAAEEMKERFVFMTGGVIPADAASYLVSSGRPTLIKPISPEEIAQLVGSTDARSLSAPTLESVPPPPPGPDARAEERAEKQLRRRQAATVDVNPPARKKGP